MSYVIGQHLSCSFFHTDNDIVGLQVCLQLSRREEKLSNFPSEILYMRSYHPPRFEQRACNALLTNQRQPDKGSLVAFLRDL